VSAGGVAPVAPPGSAVLLGGAMEPLPAGGFTSVEPELGALGLVIPLAAPLVSAPVEGVDAEGMEVEGAVAAALAGAPVEAMAEPDHQSLLARCLGEAARYSSSMA
jgi:hypothetical protein